MLYEIKQNGTSNYILSFHVSLYVLVPFYVRELTTHTSTLRYVLTSLLSGALHVFVNAGINTQDGTDLH